MKRTFFALGMKERSLLVLVLFIALGSLLYWFAALYLNATKPVPKSGGTYTEGISSQPRYINPLLLQTSDADSDLSQLIFCGLYRYDGAGSLESTLAKNLETSEDGKQYRVQMKEGAKWHDGEEVTADDVVFTVQTLQDPSSKSPLRQNWLSVEARALDRYTVEFSLKKPYFGFQENLTVGLLPKHRWQDIAPDKFLLADYNIEPVGCGPYRYGDATKDSNGNFVTYELEANSEYILGVPYISRLIFNFYPDEDTLIEAFLRKEVMGVRSLAPEKIERIKERKSAVIHEIAIPRSFAVFFNTSKSVPLAFDEVRQALNLMTNRPEIVSRVLERRGVSLSGPFAPFMKAYAGDLSWPGFDPDAAARLLEEKGWQKNDDGIWTKSGTVLHIEMFVPDWPELVQTADFLKSEWKGYGVDLTINVLSAGEIQQNIIRPREYEALLFGEAAMLDQDPYSFWHSSEKRDLGLNLSLFEEKETDDLLLAAREERDPARRMEQYRRFQEIYLREMPALFLYSPSYLFVSDRVLGGVSATKVNTPSDRFSNVHEWYVRTKRVMKE